jgi:hypothetical protein
MYSIHECKCYIVICERWKNELEKFPNSDKSECSNSGDKEN